eukprot:881560_1
MGDNLLEIDLGTNFISMQIVAELHHTCALSTANKVKCWGWNEWGGLGYGDINRRGDEANEIGQLGYGDTNNRGNEANQMGDTLLEIDLGSDFTAIPTVS